MEVLAISLIGLAVLWLGIKRPWVEDQSAKRPPRDEQVIVQLYGRMVQHFAGEGIANRPPQDPSIGSRIAQAKWSDANSAVASITELYCRARFGQTPPTSDELTIAEDHLRRLMALNKP